MKNKLSGFDVYRLCNKHCLFTCGTTEQYKKFLEMCTSGITKRDFIITLWICSDKTLLEIQIITKEFLDSLPPWE